MPTTRLADRDFRVGDSLVQPRLARIHRHGKTVHVTPRAMSVLVYLAEADGQVVSRNQILDAIWPRMSVTPDALSQCLVELRRAFGDDAKHPRTIETIQRIGVRLIASVRLEEPGAPSEHTPVLQEGRRAAVSWPGWRSRRVGLAGAAIAVAIALSAVLLRSPTNTPGRRDTPTTNTRAHEFYLSGDEYSRRLNEPQAALPLMARQFARATEEDPEFALAWARLGMAHLGLYWYGIDRAPERLALADVAIRTALALEPELPEARLARADYLLRADDDYAGALATLIATERDGPQNANLHYQRGSVYMRMGEWDRSISEHAKALELDPRNVVYLRQQSLPHMFKRDYAEVERLLDRILEIAPDDGTAHVDQVHLALYARGDTGLARRYESVAPSVSYATAHGATYVRWLAAVFDRDYAAAIRILDGAREERVFDGDLRNSFAPKALLYARTQSLIGNRAAAVRALEDAKASVERELASQRAEPAGSAQLRVTFAEILAGLGDAEGAAASLALMGNVTDVMQRSGLRLAVALRVLVPLGDNERALRELDEYLSSPGRWTIEGLAADPRLDPLRAEPEFARLVAKHRRR